MVQPGGSTEADALYAMRLRESGQIYRLYQPDRDHFYRFDHFTTFAANAIEFSFKYDELIKEIFYCFPLLYNVNFHYLFATY